MIGRLNDPEDAEMVMRRLLNSLRLRRLERRGEAVVDAEVFWDSFSTLAQDLMPGELYHTPRNLFCILSYVWAVGAKKGVVHDPAVALQAIHDQAWQAYIDMPEFLRLLEIDFPDGNARQGIRFYFEEIMAKRSTYLFLPIVSRIQRHQTGPLPQSLKSDALLKRYEHTQAAALSRTAFALAPLKTRERDIFFLALSTAGWGHGDRSKTEAQFYSEIAAQLRGLYQQDRAALKNIRRDSVASPDAQRLLDAATELTTPPCQPLLLETLHIVEGWITGPQDFDREVEVKAGRGADIR